MTLSVIIPTHNRAALAARLIRSLLKQVFSKKDLQVLLVSNFRDKKLERAIERVKAEAGSWFYDFKLLSTGEKGVNKARNLGARFAGGDILYFLDDDCFLTDRLHLQKILNLHQKHKNAAGIGGGYEGEPDGGRGDETGLPKDRRRGRSGARRFYEGQSAKWIEKARKETRQGPLDLKHAPSDRTDGPKETGGGPRPFWPADPPETGPKAKKPPAPQAGGDRGFAVSRLLGGNSSFKRDLVFVRGFFFDPEIVFGGAEKGFNQELQESGLTLLFFPELTVRHTVHLNVLGLAEKAFLQGNGAFKTHQKSGAALSFLTDMKRVAAVSKEADGAVYSSVYHFFFKLGWFQEASKNFKGFAPFWFLVLIFKSRREVYGPPAARAFFRFAGLYIWRPLSRAAGALYWIAGLYLWRPLSRATGALYWFAGLYIWRPLSRATGALYWIAGLYLWRPLSRIAGALYWFAGLYIWRPLSRATGALYWIAGLYLWRPLSRIAGALYWFAGLYIWRPLSRATGALYWIAGLYLWRPLSRIAGALYWFAGLYLWRPAVWLFYKSPFVKVYYFSKYQWNTRIAPLTAPKKRRPRFIATGFLGKKEG